MTQTAFVSGCYTGEDSLETDQYIKLARDCTIWLWNHGYSVFCPHLNSAQMERFTNQNYQIFLNFCLKVIKSGLIDFLVLLPNWAASSGANKEINLAKKLTIPVIEWKKLTGVA